MRYVLSFAILAMFMLVACPQRIIQPAPQLPPTTGSETATMVVAPPPLTKPPTLNPGKLTIEVLTNEGNRKKLQNDLQGVPQERLTVKTDEIWPWKVHARSIDTEPLNSDDILLSSFPNDDRVTTFDVPGVALGKTKSYQFQMPYAEGQRTPPAEFIIVARNKKFCRSVALGNHNAVDGVTPDIPDKESDCNKINADNIFNFDQKLRLYVHVENVRGHMTDEKDAKHERRRKFFCKVIYRAKERMMTQLERSWKSDNDITDMLRGISFDIADALFEYKFSMKGFTCSESEYKINNND